MLARITERPAKLKALASRSDTARRLQIMPDMGPITAVAVEAFGPEMAQFKTGRNVATGLAWAAIDSAVQLAVTNDSAQADKAGRDRAGQQGT